MLVLHSWVKHQAIDYFDKHGLQVHSHKSPTRIGTHAGLDNILARETQCNRAESQARCECESQFCHLLLCNPVQVIHSANLSFSNYRTGISPSTSQNCGEGSMGLFIKVNFNWNALILALQGVHGIKVDLKLFRQLLPNHSIPLE